MDGKKVSEFEKIEILNKQQDKDVRMIEGKIIESGYII